MGKWSAPKREYVDCVLGLGERATVSQMATRELCGWEETRQLDVSARGQRAPPVAHPLKPVKLGS